jgi:hypothetical protein
LHVTEGVGECQPGEKQEPVSDQASGIRKRGTLSDLVGIAILGVPGINLRLANKIGTREYFWANFAFLGISIDR